VLLGHPGIGPGKGYFHRGDRISFLREHGFAVMTFDHGGFGESDPPQGLYHREWADVLRWARRRFPRTPLHVWGVSLGGYFAHHALAADEAGVESAIFEQVAPDLFGYRVKGMPHLRTGTLLSKTLAPGGARWFPAISHALHVKADRILYLSGGADEGIPLADARALVHAASPLAQHTIAPDAAHLEAWKLGGERVRAAVRDCLSG
jgi:pimeloyl-ACP methyl ester carboxylesterase